jgi:hypothetical protein
LSFRSSRVRKKLTCHCLCWYTNHQCLDWGCEQQFILFQRISCSVSTLDYTISSFRSRASRRAVSSWLRFGATSVRLVCVVQSMVPDQIKKVTDDTESSVINRKGTILTTDFVWPYNTSYRASVIGSIRSWDVVTNKIRSLGRKCLTRL